MGQSKLTRRRFIQLSSLAALSAPGWIGCARVQPASSLTPQELALVEAIADQIIPPDASPGGKQAGVARFIERQLRGPYRRFAAVYREGLTRIDSTSRALHGRSLANLPFDGQTSVLAALESDRVPGGIWKPGQAAEFFRLIADHCMQGFYGSPRHGGNLDCASWRMLDLPYPQIAGRVV